ncbi:hypothetical protein RR46_02298 [Papilio xuthus]|uniref:Uncharacterized protein n=1 Tax=Papilio xuthus TaxID=66420 RepID=A0A194QQG9_PAPXU|nr:hypothetical protein RR46_02298 [Papilio xuthus]
MAGQILTDVLFPFPHLFLRKGWVVEVDFPDERMHRKGKYFLSVHPLLRRLKMLYSVILFILKWLLMTKAAYDTSSKDITYWTTEKPDILSKIRHITETKDGKTNVSCGWSRGKQLEMYVLFEKNFNVAAVYLVLIICTFQDVEVKSMRVSRQVTSDFQSQVTNSVNASDNSLAENVGQVIDEVYDDLINDNCNVCIGRPYPKVPENQYNPSDNKESGYESQDCYTENTIIDEECEATGDDENEKEYEGKNSAKYDDENEPEENNKYKSSIQCDNYVENQHEDNEYPENNYWKPMVSFDDKVKPVKETDVKSDDKFGYLRPYQPPSFIYGLNTYPHYAYDGFPAHLHKPIWSYPDINYFVKKVNKDKPYVSYENK